MPNRPSNNALPNTCILYHWTPTQDEDGGWSGLSGDYSLIATNVRCAAQLVSSAAGYDAQDRPYTENTWHIGLRTDYDLQLRDRIDTIQDGIVHSMFVDGYLDRAGRGATWKVVATERPTARVTGTTGLPLQDGDGFLMLDDGGLLILAPG